MSGKQFKELIRQKGISQKEVAHAIGMNTNALNSFLNGYTMDLHKSKYYRLCDFLGLDVRY